jgi:hypothetical protein
LIERYVIDDLQKNKHYIKDKVSEKPEIFHFEYNPNFNINPITINVFIAQICMDMIKCALHQVLYAYLITYLVSLQQL